MLLFRERDEQRGKSKHMCHWTTICRYVIIVVLFYIDTNSLANLVDYLFILQYKYLSVSNVGLKIIALPLI